MDYAPCVLAAAVSHCESLGIFHRDFKPGNILGWVGGAMVRLADFASQQLRGEVGNGELEVFTL